MPDEFTRMVTLGDLGASTTVPVVTGSRAGSPAARNLSSKFESGVGGPAHDLELMPLVLELLS